MAKGSEYPMSPPLPLLLRGTNFKEGEKGGPSHCLSLPLLQCYNALRKGEATYAKTFADRTL